MASKCIRSIISSAKAPQAIGPYSQAVRVNNMVYLSGQIGLVPETMQVVSGGVVKEAEQALTNLGQVLEAAGSSYDNVVKTTVFLKNMDDYQSVNEVYSKFFSNAKPARSAIAVATLPKNVNVEIEAIAIVGEVENQ